MSQGRKLLYRFRIAGEAFGCGEEGSDAGDDAGCGWLEVGDSIRADGALEEGDSVEEGGHEGVAVVLFVCSCGGRGLGSVDCVNGSGGP